MALNDVTDKTYITIEGELTVPEITGRVNDHIQEGRLPNAYDLIASLLYKDNEAIRGLCGLVARGCVEMALKERDTLRFFEVHGCLPDHLLNIARRIYEETQTPEDPEHNFIVHSALELLAGGEINRAYRLKDKYVPSLEFDKERLTKGGKAAFCKGWVCQGLKAYKEAGRKPAYRSVKEGILAARRRLDCSSEDERMGDCYDRYLRGIRKGMDFITKHHLEKAIKDKLFSRLRI